jgi:hypothetical protein
MTGRKVVLRSDGQKGWGFFAGVVAKAERVARVPERR